MSLVFPFVYAEVKGLGTLFYPFVRVSLKTNSGWQEFDFLVDTGADVTTLPKTLLPFLAVKEGPLKKTKTQGVGGIRVDTLDLKIPVKIGRDEFEIYASIIDSEDESSPLLLGRKDIFDERFSLELDSQKKVTVLRKNH